MHAHRGEVRAGLDHRDELVIRVGVLLQLGHFHHEGREDFLLQHFAGDRELALHQGVPLLEAVDALDECLDVHLAVADLGVVDVVFRGDDVDLVAGALPDLLGDGNGEPGHTLVLLAEALAEAAEFEAGLRLFADFQFCHVV